MKKLLRLIVTIGVLSAAAYIVRYKLLPPAEPVVIPPPQFRRASAPSAPPPPAPATLPTASVTPIETPADHHAEPVDDLKVVKGIGPVFEQRLNDVGISSLGSLVRSDAATVAGQLDVSEAQVADWIRQARGLVY